MKTMSTKQAAELWGISERMVRKHCVERNIPNAIYENGNWLIPYGISKPKRKPRTKPEGPALPRLAKRLAYQKKKNNHFGIYEYIQVNLTYSSNRMASNRLTRNEVMEVYRTNRITSTFEPVKVDDIIETINHFSAVRYVIAHVMDPLTQKLIQALHSELTYGTYADRKKKIASGEYRSKPAKLGVAPHLIRPSLSALIKEYESGEGTMENILDFHARFECIHPFEDYNGRIGRLIMLKECLRHEVTPFIVDDKRRREYNCGIAEWDTNRERLIAVCKEAQERYGRFLEICKNFQYERHE